MSKGDAMYWFFIPSLLAFLIVSILVMSGVDLLEFYFIEITIKNVEDVISIVIAVTSYLIIHYLIAGYKVKLSNYLRIFF